MKSSGFVNIDDNHLINYGYIAEFGGSVYRYRQRTHFARYDVYRRKSDKAIANAAAERQAMQHAASKGWDLLEIYPIPQHGLLSAQAQLIAEKHGPA